MLNTYIKNQGITKTIIHDNNRNHVNQINWDVDYDGDIANLSINTNTDGKHEHFDLSLDNQDLANILNIQSVNIPIDKRLKMDFQEPLYIELPTTELEPRKPKHSEEIIYRPISSPSSGEELIIPLTIDRDSKDLFTLTPHKKHKRHKSHVTHRVYKKHKSKSKRSSKAKSRKSSRKTTTITDLI